MLKLKYFYAHIQEKHNYFFHYNKYIPSELIPFPKFKFFRENFSMISMANAVVGLDLVFELLLKMSRKDVLLFSFLLQRKIGQVVIKNEDCVELVCDIYNNNGFFSLCHATP